MKRRIHLLDLAGDIVARRSIVDNTGVELQSSIFGFCAIGMMHERQCSRCLLTFEARLSGHPSSTALVSAYARVADHAILEVRGRSLCGREVESQHRSTASISCDIDLGVISRARKLVREALEAAGRADGTAVDMLGVVESSVVDHKQLRWRANWLGLTGRVAELGLFDLSGVKAWLLYGRRVEVVLP